MGSSQMVSISLYPWKLDCIPFPPPTAHLVPLEVNKQLQVSALGQAPLDKGSSLSSIGFNN